MKRFAIKLLTNLKVSSVETVSSGTIWEGTVDSLPEYIQAMVRAESRSIAIRELPEEVILPEVPEVVKIPELKEPEIPERKEPEIPEPVVAKPSPRKTPRKPIKK